MGAMTLLNKHGDWTLTWAKENDEKASAMILALLEKGIVFWIVHPRGARSKATADNLDEAMKRRHVAIDDEDIGQFLSSGAGEMVRSSTEPTKPVRRPRGATKQKQAQDIAGNESVGIQQRRGG